MKSVFCITGPTASGKTDLALKLAQKFSLRVINADVFQCYKEIPIISNQPASIGVENHFFADRSIAKPLNAGDYSREVEPFLDSKSILVGTGLYIGSALYGLDPVTKKGTPFQGPSKLNYKMIVLDPDRASLYEKINERVDVMLEAGARQEVENLITMIEKKELSSEAPSLRAIGIPQLMKLIRSEISEDEAISSWKQETRRLAKRQWTWLRKFCAPAENRLWVKDVSVEADQIGQFFANE